MLGDFGALSLQGIVDTNKGEALFALPLGAGGLRAKISENNKALPMDRVYFQYSHFHNATNIDFDTATPGNEFSGHLDRYTVGVEKTFHDGLCSVDLRMPFATSQVFSSADVDVSNGSIGNLTAIAKLLLAANDRVALATGIGINMPTGSDVQVTTYQVYSLANESVHLSPFLGALYQPNDRIFYHAFLEIDVPLNGNPFTVDGGSGPVPAGVLTEQTLLQADVAAGYWIYRNPNTSVTGLASVVEFHYTGTLNDGDVIDVGDRFGSLLNRFDMVHLTVGLHTELHQNTTLRIGGVFPLNDGLDRAFDAEVQVSVNRYY